MKKLLIIEGMEFMEEEIQSSMKAIEHLCRELNETETVFPGTEMQLIYEVVS